MLHDNTDEPLNEPTEEISINKDQADCLLIVLTQHYEYTRMQIANHDEEASVKMLLAEYEVTEEKAREQVREFNALNISTHATIPGILSEIKEIYPMLSERGKVESRIKIVAPSWTKKP